MPIALIALAFGLALVMAWPAVVKMVHGWEREEYSYGYFIPFLVAFFIWQRKNDLARVTLQPSWWGVAVALFGALVVVTGSLATIPTLMQYGFVVTVHGVALTFLGWQGYRIVAVPLALLFLAIPLPNFFYNTLSLNLKLLSAKIGVEIIRQFGISVFLDGNIIQLADMKLEVAEACNGLRYLFPLMAVAFIMAYVYRAPLWKRAMLFLSSIPITVLMNSLRIGLIGVSVEYWGPGMAEGFLHDFEGWVMFMVSLGVLLLEMLVLNAIGRRRASLRDTFYVEVPGPLPPGTQLRLPGAGPAVLALLGVLLAGAVIGQSTFDRSETIPQRALTFAEFPSRLGEWRGRVQRMQSILVDKLNFDDYILADYQRSTGEQVNLYVAYYESQRAGSSIHSPSSCLPGGGWKMQDFRQVTVDDIHINGRPLRVNRSIIKKGEAKQLVYYWFQGRGRVLTNEYLVKLHLLTDGITMNRSDGALVRLVMPVPPGEAAAEVETRLVEFARLLAPQLERFIPN